MKELEKALAKRELGLPLTEREEALIALYANDCDHQG